LIGTSAKIVSAPVAPGTGNPFELDAAGSCVEGAETAPAEADPADAADALAELTTADGLTDGFDVLLSAEELGLDDAVEADWCDA
jgi:hypothetical protein